jgi:hypothetical protein
MASSLGAYNLIPENGSQLITSKEGVLEITGKEKPRRVSLPAGKHFPQLGRFVSLGREPKRAN